MEHTPGPWQVQQWSSGDWHITPVGTDSPLIASTSYNPTPQPIDASTEEANARLIAAAPDLLATLAAIVLPYREWLGDHADDAPTVERIELTTSALREGLAVYDKATGLSDA